MDSWYNTLKPNEQQRNFTANEHKAIAILTELTEGATIAKVTCCVEEMIRTCLPMIGQFFDTMIVASSDKE